MGESPHRAVGGFPNRMKLEIPCHSMTNPLSPAPSPSVPPTRLDAWAAPARTLVLAAFLALAPTALAQSDPNYADFDNVSMLWGSANLLPNTPNQPVELYLNNSGSKTLLTPGFLIDIQVGDGASGPPTINGVDFNSAGHLNAAWPYTGTVQWAPNMYTFAAGGGSGSSVVLLAIPPGISDFATVLVDTTGVSGTGGHYPLYPGNDYLGSMIEFIYQNGEVGGRHDLSGNIGVVNIVPEAPPWGYTLVFGGLLGTAVLRRLRSGF